MADRDFAWLADHLRRSGIPASRVRRTIGELEAHWLALVDDQVARGVPISTAQDQASHRLGTDEELLAGVLQAPELRSWGARQPWICLIVPGCLLLTAELLALFSLVGVLELLGHWIAPTSDWNSPGSPAGRIVAAYRLVFLYVLPLVASALLSVYAVRRRFRALWPTVGLSVIAALAALMNFTARPPIPGARHGIVGGGLWLTPNLRGLEHFGLRWLPLLGVSMLFYIWWRRPSRTEATRAT